MKSNFIGAAVVAVAALTSVAASAEAFNPYLWDQMKAPSTRTRAEVRAELLQAQREGYDANLNNGYKQAKAAPTSNKTRAQVQGEVGAPVSVSAMEHDYPVAQ